MEITHSDPKRIVLPASSKSSPISAERGQQPRTHDASGKGGNSSLITTTGNDVAESSAPGPAKPAVQPTARRPPLRRTKRISSRAFPRPVRPRLSKIFPSTEEKTSHEHTVASSRDLSHRSLEPRPNFTGVDNSANAHGAKTFSEPPKALPLRTGGAYHNIGEGMWLIDKGRNEGDNIDDDEEEEESDESKDSDDEDEEYEDETEGEDEAASPSQGDRTKLSRGTQAYSQDTKASFHQSSTVLPKHVRPAPQAVYPVPQGNHNRAPPVARRPLPRPDSTNLHYSSPPEMSSSRPASFGTSHPRPHRAPEGPQRTTWPNEVGYLRPFGPASRSSGYRSSGFSYSGDTPGLSSERGDGSEPGASEQRSLYSRPSNMSIARSIYLEQQVSRREEEAARREEEAMQKEEDARGLEMAARRAFAWVQGLEARAGRIHDAAMAAEAKAKLRNAEIWEREAEVLRREAEAAKREVEVAKREIAAERAEQQARRKARETRRKEAQLLLKEEDMRRKELETLRMEEDVRQKNMEIRKREGRLQEREKGRRNGPEDLMGAKIAVISAWEKLKGRISREPRADKGSPAHVHRFGDLDDLHHSDSIDGTSESPLTMQTRDIGQDSSTRTNTPHPRNVEQWRTMVDFSAIPDLEDDELKSESDVVPSDSGTSAMVSAEYTVKTVHSYKERLHRTPAGYFRHIK